MTGRIVAVGQEAVFTGAWLATGDRFRIGFTGRLVEPQRLGAVFDITSAVARELCAEQDRMHADRREYLLHKGSLNAEEAGPMADLTGPSLAMHGGDLVYQIGAGLPGVLLRFDRTSDGSYRIDLPWPWVIADPADCDHVAV